MRSSDPPFSQKPNKCLKIKISKNFHNYCPSGPAHTGIRRDKERESSNMPSISPSPARFNNGPFYFQCNIVTYIASLLRPPRLFTPQFSLLWEGLRDLQGRGGKVRLSATFPAFNSFAFGLINNYYSWFCLRFGCVAISGEAKKNNDASVARPILPLPNPPSTPRPGNIFCFAVMSIPATRETMV